MWELLFIDMYPSKMFLPFQIVLHLHIAGIFPWSSLCSIMKRCIPSLSWMCQYLDFSHSLNPLSRLTNNLGVSSFGCQYYHLSHPHLVVVEHRPYKSCNYACILYHPGLGGPSSWTTTKLPDRLWAAVRGTLLLFSFPLHHEDLNV